MAGLVLACLLPSLLIAAIFIVADYRSQRRQVVLDAVSTARGLAAALDRDLSSTEAGLQVLATAPALINGDLAAFYQRAKLALPFQNVTNFVLLDPSGRQLLNTLKPWGEPLPVVGGPAQLLRSFETQAPVLTDLFIGPVTGEPILAIGVPVYVRGKVAYCLSAGIVPERVSAVLRAQNLPKEWIGAVLDGQGKLIARTHDAERFVGQSAVPDLVRMAAQMPEGNLQTVTLEGIPVVTVFSRSHLSPWTVAIGIPQAELVADLKQSMVRLAISSACLFAVALWLAWRVAVSQVVTPADRLLGRMRRISSGGEPGPRDAALSSLEFAALEDGLDEMHARLLERDRERDALIQRLSTTLESISDGFFLLDAEWRLAYINAPAEALLRCERQTVLGQSLWTVINPDESAPLLEQLQQAMRTRAAVSFDVQLPSLQLWLELTAYPSELGLSVYFRDVLALRSAQRARQAQLQAEAANTAKTEFVSRMSHELRTPLNAVIGFAQVLRMDGQHSLSEKQLGMIDHIESAGQHLQAMIRDVLDLSSLELGAMRVKLEPVDVRATLNNCYQMMGTLASAAGISMSESIDAQVTCVQADFTRLTQVLLNLLSNAIKYNRAGGRVLLRAEVQGGYTRFSVQDTGLGMTPEQQQHLFEPFNRLGREQGAAPGAGIGLVICKRLVELMGGVLEVAAQAGQGSVFSFSLPNSVRKPAPAASVPSALPAAAYGSRLVLNVEDNPLNAELVAALLAQRPQIQLVHVETVAAALASLKTRAFDLVLLDMQLPDGSGLDVLAWLRSQPQELPPVIVLSANATPEHDRKALQAGALRCLRKPLDMRVALEVVDTVLTKVSSVAQG